MYETGFIDDTAEFLKTAQILLHLYSVKSMNRNQTLAMYFHLHSNMNTACTEKHIKQAEEDWKAIEAALY